MLCLLVQNLRLEHLLLGAEGTLVGRNLPRIKII